MSRREIGRIDGRQCRIILSVGEYINAIIIAGGGLIQRSTQIKGGTIVAAPGRTGILDGIVPDSRLVGCIVRLGFAGFEVQLVIDLCDCLDIEYGECVWVLQVQYRTGGPIPTNDAGGGATGCHGNDEVEYARCVDGYQYNVVTEYCLNLKILVCSI